jgi:hypothetical protein
LQNHSFFPLSGEQLSVDGCDTTANGASQRLLSSFVGNENLERLLLLLNCLKSKESFWNQKVALILKV